MHYFYIATFKNAKHFFNNRKEYSYHSVITDKVIVKNFFSEKKVKCCLLSSFLTNSDYLKIFHRRYKEFNSLLRSLDNNANIKKKLSNDDINIFYNTYRYFGSRDYVGLKLLEYSLKKLLKKNKVKKITFYGEINGQIFTNKIYFDHFQHIFGNKIRFSSIWGGVNVSAQQNPLLRFLMSKNAKLYFVLTGLLRFLLRGIFKSSTRFQIKNLIKKQIDQLNFFSKKKVLIFEPSWDFFYCSFNTSSFLYFNLPENFNFENISNSEKKSKSFKVKHNIDFNLISFLIKNAFRIDQKINQDFKKIDFLITKHSLKNVMWCSTPSPLLANVIKKLKKKRRAIKIFGNQHGGAYSIQENSDMEHNDSDYNFCDKFLSFGLSKNHINQKKFLEVGSFKSVFYDKIIRNIKNLSEKVMIVPTDLSAMIIPDNSKKQDEKFLIQKQVCDYLKKKKIQTIIKTLKHASFEYSPLMYNLQKNYTNFIIDNNPLYESILNFRPKIIIIDYLSTSLYECLYSGSEIIIFLDKYNMPPKDVLKLLKQRVHLVRNVDEFKKTVDLINKGKIRKQSEKFKDKFFSLKINESKFNKQFGLE